MAHSQVRGALTPWAATISDSAWRSKPSWYLVTARRPDVSLSAERRCPAALERRSPRRRGSHATYVSNATVAVEVIERAASEVRSPAMA